MEYLMTFDLLLKLGHGPTLGVRNKSRSKVIKCSKCYKQDNDFATCTWNLLLFVMKALRCCRTVDLRSAPWNCESRPSNKCNKMHMPTLFPPEIIPYPLLSNTKVEVAPIINKGHSSIRFFVIIPLVFIQSALLI